jgi:dihydrofolate synthase/folylpolyglutamate synthase
VSQERAGWLPSPERLDRPFADPLVGRLFPPLATGVHWGLERVQNALDALGNPQRSFASLHVGGTNGKGSVAVTLATVLERAGLRVGCYTSPHLCSFRERVVVGGRALDEDLLLVRAEEIREVVVRFGLTFFEAATVLGFQAFAQEGVDVGVVEVGLGGRLDATNVLMPVVSAITNVADDHRDYLGETLLQIGREKAGIIKPGVPLVTAETDPEILAMFREVASGAGSPTFSVRPDEVVRDLEIAADHTSFTLPTSTWGELRIRTPLVGRHQAANAALAVAILERLPDDLRPEVDALVTGIGAVVHPGRDQIERVGEVTWLFDVAHNTAGVRSLVDTVDRLGLPRPLVALVGVLGDKDWRSMLPPLFSRVDYAVLTQPPSAPPERRWRAREAADSVAHVCPMRVDDDFVSALRRAEEEAGSGTVIVTGSVHTVGSALKVLGKEPLQDGG